MSDAVVQIRGLRKTYKRSWFDALGTHALAGVDLTIHRGDIWALAGPNGAGKTTTLHCILGLLQPTAGEVLVLGRDPRDSRAAMGYQSEIFFSYSYLTATQTLAFYARLSDVNEAALPCIITTALAQVGLTDVAHKPIRGFSKGMMQRLGLAQSIIHNPDIIIWDEPSTGLDPEGRRLVIDLLTEFKTLGKTVILSTHILDDIERVCDHIAIMARGQLLAADSIEAWLRAHPGASLEETYLAVMQEQSRVA